MLFVEATRVLILLRGVAFAVKLAAGSLCVLERVSDGVSQTGLQ